MQLSLIALAVVCLGLTEGIELVDDGHGGLTFPVRNFTIEQTRGWIETFIEVDELKSEDVDSIVDCTKQAMHMTDRWYSLMNYLDLAQFDLEGNEPHDPNRPQWGPPLKYPEEGSNIVNTFIRYYHHYIAIIHAWFRHFHRSNRDDPDKAAECSKSFLQLTGEVLSQHLLLDPPHDRNDPDSQWFNLFVDSYVYSVSGLCPSAYPVCRGEACPYCLPNQHKACPNLGYFNPTHINASTSEHPCGKLIESLDHLARFACPNARRKYCNLTRESVLASKREALKEESWIHSYSSWKGADPYDCASWMENNICVT